MPHTVLVADDSKTIRRVAEIVFAQEGEYRLVTATSGEEAIVKARELKPDLVLADHNMPGKDGYEVARALVPEGMKVVLLTGSSAPYDEGKAMNVGVQERIEKPFDCQSVLEKVAALVGAPAPAPAPGLRPVGSAPVAAATATQKYAPTAAATPAAATPAAATPAAATPAATAPVAPVAPAVPQAQPAQPAQSASPATPAQPSGWTASNVSGALGSFSGDDKSAVDNLGGAVAKAAEPAVSAAVASADAGDASPEAITAATREIIERVVWEVVPELAETLIREEIQRLLGR